MDNIACSDLPFLNYMCMLWKKVVVIYISKVVIYISKVMFILLIEKDITNLLIVLTLMH